MGRLSLSARVGGRGRIFAVTTVWFVLGMGSLVLSTPAFAEYMRPFKSALDGTPTGSSGELVPFGELECIAIETGEGGGNRGNVWFGDGTNDVIDEFSPTNEFLRQLTGMQTHSCAWDESTGELVSGGAFEWIAVDDSGGPANGDVYFARSGDAETGGSVRRTADFTCSAPGSSEYIRNGDELIGKPEWEREPAESWGNGNVVEGVAVDSGGETAAGEFAGNIYVINNRGFDRLEVDVFSSAGCFERAITGNVEVVNNGVKEVKELFVGRLLGVAVDPLNGNVLIKGTTDSSGWIVGEFAPEGKFLGEITGRSREDQFGTQDPEGGVAVDAAGDLYVAADEVKENEAHEVESERYVVDVFGEGGIFRVRCRGRRLGWCRGCLVGWLCVVR